MPGKISDEAGRVTVEALKENGVNFVTILPDIQHTSIQKPVQADESFTYYTTSDEPLGFAACVGAWFGGKKPALVITTAGLHNLGWAISAFKNYHSPLLMLIPNRGVVGDAIWFMRKYIHKIEQFLEFFDVAYEVVNKVEDIKPAIKRAETSINNMLVPVAILYSGDTLW